MGDRLVAGRRRAQGVSSRKELDRTRERSLPDRVVVDLEPRMWWCVQEGQTRGERCQDDAKRSLLTSLDGYCLDVFFVSFEASLDPPLARIEL